MTGSYYDRKKLLNGKEFGSFYTEEDRRNESIASKSISKYMNCELRSLGRFSPIDWYAEREGHLIGLIELKSHPHKSGKYSTTFLNLRKWLALRLGSVGTGVPAFYIKKFNDGIFYIDIDKVDASNIIIGGCKKIVKSCTDIEPVIRIPIREFHKIEEYGKEFDDG